MALLNYPQLWHRTAFKSKIYRRLPILLDSRCERLRKDWALLADRDVPVKQHLQAVGGECVVSSPSFRVIGAE
eukprot:scaffold548981_cov19-Prasinocladus_malaysianus.AAC.1